MSTIERTCSILAALMRGDVVTRNSLAGAQGMTVASADRYVRTLTTVPGVSTRKLGRQLFLSFSFGDALKAVGR